MRWIAPPQRDAATTTLEARLWAAADQLRANSGLTCSLKRLFVDRSDCLRMAQAAHAQWILTSYRASSRSAVSSVSSSISA
jgi:hypothetical protein